jgi:ATP-binding cassette subfamily C protein CydD
VTGGTDTRAQTRLYAAGSSGIRRSVLVLGARALLLAGAALAVGWIIDSAVRGARVAPGLWWLSALLAGAAGFGWLWPLVANRTRAVVESDLKRRILDKVIGSPAAGFRSGEVANRATEGVAAVGSLAGRFLPQLLGGIVIPLMICGVIATIDVPSALILLVTVPAVPLLLRAMESRFTSVTRQYNETADRLTARFFDGIQGMKTLRALDASNEYGRRLEAESDQLRSQTMALLRVNQLALFIVDSLFTLGTVVAAGAAAIWRLQSGAISVGDAVAVVLLGAALIEPISQIGRFFYVGAIGRASAKDIKRFLDDFGGIDRFAPRSGDQGWVRLQDVTFSYERHRKVLDSVSLRVDPGETIGLVGPSGSGKSTIAGLVTGLLEPDEGVVSVGGRVAMVSQQPFLFHGTLRENLMLADPSAADEQMWAALDAADLAGLVEEREEGLDLEVGERGLQLSGGEAQRLTIARLILADAPIVVLDEPTSNVDIETETRVRKALESLMAGRTVIIIAHRQSTLADVDRVVSVVGGTISEAEVAR